MNGATRRNPKQTRPTYATTEVVRVEIRGIPMTHPSYVMCPDDCGLVSKFWQWCDEQKIGALWTLTTGGGFHSGLYAAADIPAIRAFLAQHADETKEPR